MTIIGTVNDIMSHIKDGDSKYVTLITSCSKYEVYSNFYSNFPYEMKEHDVTLIDFQNNNIILYIL